VVNGVFASGRPLCRPPRSAPGFSELCPGSVVARLGRPRPGDASWKEPDSDLCEPRRRAGQGIRVQLPLTELANAPVSALSGVSEADAEALQRAFNIKTVADLAGNKYIRAAQAIVELSQISK
jgi:hypothetical protein